MNKNSIRQEFEQVVGKTELTKFVIALHKKAATKGRLLFWQESIWSPFAKARDLPETDLTEIRGFFSYCPVHNQEFQKEDVPVLHGTFRKLQGEEDEFPFANDFIAGPCWGGEEKMMNVDFCPDCRAIKNQRQDITCQ